MRALVRPFAVLVGVAALVACADSPRTVRDSPRTVQLESEWPLTDLAPTTTTPVVASTAPIVPAIAAATPAPVPVAAPATTSTPLAPPAPSPTPLAPPAPSTTEPVTTTPPAPGAGRAFTLLVTGDLLSHIPVVRQANSYAGGAGYDFVPMFAAVRSTVDSADLAICHMETPVAPPGTEPDPTPPDYGVPGEITTAIKSAGFDRCSLASNHALDKGAAGIDATLAALDAVGVGHAGMARTPAEAAPSIFDVRGVSVAHMSYTFGYNSLSPAGGETWRSNLIDPDRIIAEAQDARADGAEFVILSLHWGAEGSGSVTPDQQRWASQITASNAVDVIVGHHAHVVQPIAQVNGHWVVFGLGNFLSAMDATTGCCGIRGQDGMMVRIAVAEQPDGTFAVDRPEVIPTYVDRSSYVILSVQAGLADPAMAGAVGADALRQSLARTAGMVGEYIAGWVSG